MNILYLERYFRKGAIDFTKINFQRLFFSISPVIYEVVIKSDQNTLLIFP